MEKREAIMGDGKSPRWFGRIDQFIKTSSKLLFHPGQFYREREQSDENVYMGALPFLVSTSIPFSLLASLFMAQNKALSAFIFFMNAVSMPFIMAFILYVVGLLICRGVFTYQTLFRITAYAQVTLLVAWLPGLSWMVGLWKFYLMGLGMVKLGRISGMKALLLLLAMVGILVLLIKALRPLIGHAG